MPTPMPMKTWDEILALAESRGRWVSRERLISLRNRAIEMDVDGGKLGGPLRESVPGVFVEFGVARGCSATVLAQLAASQGRELWLLDNFQGLPPSRAEDGEEARDKVGACKGDEQDVRRYLAEAVPAAKIQFLVGDFEQTAPELALRLFKAGVRIALLHLDGDWYRSTQVALEHAGPLMSPGGVIVVDDYGHWEGCKKAVDEYLTAHPPSGELQRCEVQAHWVVR